MVGQRHTYLKTEALDDILHTASIFQNVPYEPCGKWHIHLSFMTSVDGSFWSHFISTEELFMSSKLAHREFLGPWKQRGCQNNTCTHTRSNANSNTHTHTVEFIITVSQEAFWQWWWQLPLNVDVSVQDFTFECELKTIFCTNYSEDNGSMLLFDPVTNGNRKSCSEGRYGLFWKE